jgi:hypothetical protein
MHHYANLLNLQELETRAFFRVVAFISTIEPKNRCSYLSSFAIIRFQVTVNIFSGIRTQENFFEFDLFS